MEHLNTLTRTPDGRPNRYYKIFPALEAEQRYLIAGAMLKALETRGQRDEMYDSEFANHNPFSLLYDHHGKERLEYGEHIDPTDEMVRHKLDVLFRDTNEFRAYIKGSDPLIPNQDGKATIHLLHLGLGHTTLEVNPDWLEPMPTTMESLAALWQKIAAWWKTWRTRRTGS